MADRDEVGRRRLDCIYRSARYDQFVETIVETPRAGAGGFGHGDAGWAVDGVAGRHDPRVGDDHYTQAGNLYRLLPAAEKQHLVDNIAGAMRVVSLDIIQRQLAHYDQADAAYGAGVRASLAKVGVQLDR